MSEKRVKYNEVYISGECISVTDARRVNEGTGLEALAFKLHIETATNEIKIVEYYANMFRGDGSPNPIYTGLETICNEIKTRVDNGTGDRVNCSCTLEDNSYYSNGTLVEGVRIAGNFCNREEEGKSIKSSQLWRVDTLIEEMSENEDAVGKYLGVKGLVNKYGKQGFYANFRIHDEEMMKAFKELYAIGSVGKLEGSFKEIVTVEEGTGGFGSRNKPKRSIERYLEVEGGDPTITVESITDTKHPFHAENIQTMKEKIVERLQKSKDKDAAKMANTKKVDDNDLPF
ncbi:MAG: hypothetical protein ACRCX2_10745 [Paraclostridium sp.]